MENLAITNPRINEIMVEFPPIVKESNEAMLRVMEEGVIELTLINIITYPFVWAVTWVWRTTGSDVMWDTVIEMV